MFIGRKRELTTLEELYQKPGFAMAVIYGRRRIGKSTLINEFVKGKRSIFYTSSKVSSVRNLELFSSMVTMEMDGLMDGVTFSSLESVFDYLTRKMEGMNEKLVLVIDELPYWAEKDDALLSVLQKYIDTRWLEANLMVILCGSALSFMENSVLSEKSPIFGRRNIQIKLDVFDYLDSAAFVPSYSPEEKAIVYGITGGVAKYLSLINPSISLDENIKRLFFSPSGYLFDEPRNLLVQEFSDISVVNGIVEQIAYGSNTVSEIASRVREKDQTVLYTLGKLVDVGIVEKKHCILEEKNKKKIHYVLKDTMFRFWYTFIPKAYSVIEMGRGDIYYDKVVKNSLHSFMGPGFEDMCRYYTLLHGIEGEFGSFVTKVGSWWGVGTTKENGEYITQNEDIDVVAISEIEKKMILGECKFTNDKVGEGILNTLKRRSTLVNSKYQIEKLILFSLSGFSDELKKEDDLVLLSLSDMYR